MTGYIIAGSHFSVIHRKEACASRRSQGDVVAVEFNWYQLPNSGWAGVLRGEHPISTAFRHLCGICWRGANP